jgi:hypothetical protein
MTYHHRRRPPAYIPVKIGPGDTVKKDDKGPSKRGERVDELWTFERLIKGMREWGGKRPRRVQKERRERARVYKCKDRLGRSKASNDRSSHAASPTVFRTWIPFDRRRSRDHPRGSFP